MERNQKTIGQVIDDVIAAFESLSSSDQVIALRAVAEHLRLSAPTLFSESSSERNSKDPTPFDGMQLVDIRSFKDQKRPGTAVEMACVVAYYLTTLAVPADRKQEITANDLETFFKQAGYPLPKRKEQVLVDGKAAGYFDSAARGRYRLNPVGHNLVVHHLPRVQK